MPVVELRKDENPRWTLCRAAIGREPAGYEFVLWLDDCWRKFADSIKAPHNPGETRATDAFMFLWWDKKLDIDASQDMFDQWLKEQIEAGHFKEMPWQSASTKT